MCSVGHDIGSKKYYTAGPEEDSNLLANQIRIRKTTNTREIKMRQEIRRKLLGQVFAPMICICELTVYFFIVFSMSIKNLQFSRHYSTRNRLRISTGNL